MFEFLINADDLGLSEEVNEAIIYGFQQGFLDRTSLMVNMPFCDDAVRKARQYGFDDKSVAHEMYYAFVSDPGNYCKYVLGMLGFEQLKTKAQSELSDKFNLKNFHQYVLDMGPVQFDILFNNLDAWIKKEK